MAAITYSRQGDYLLPNLTIPEGEEVHLGKYAYLRKQYLMKNRYGMYLNLLTAGGMMGSMMKGEKDVLTLQIKAGGPLQGLTVTADSQGNVKGYVGNPDVCIPANSKGKLDVAGAVGPGFLTVIKDMGLKEPYSGQVMLQTCEIAEDLTYYFATSEQVPSAVGLGVLMNKNNTVRQAGGFIVQLMPFAEEEVISRLEQNVQKINSVTNLLEEGHTPESMLEYILGDFGVEITEKIPASFYCNCSKERVKKAIISIGKKDLNEMIAEGKPIENWLANCSPTVRTRRLDKWSISSTVALELIN